MTSDAQPPASLTVGLVQINTGFDGSAYLPHSTAMLEAYARRHVTSPERLTFLLPIYRRIRPKEGARQLAGANVVGFSIYVWNERITLAMAEQLKQCSPETVVVLGGPQVPDRAEAFLRAHPFVDLVCHGEGEQTFAELLERLPGRDWEGLEGTSYLDGDGRFLSHGRRPRLDLATVPSPFLEGVFDPLLAAHPDQVWRATWETNRGCPFSCTFCDWGSAIAAKVNRFDIERLEAEIQWFADRHIDYVFIADANFGILPRDVDLAQRLVEVATHAGFPRHVFTNYTKNQTERAWETQRLLAEAGLMPDINVSIQSMSPHVLEAIKRKNISLMTYESLQGRFNQRGFPHYTDIIVGLPGETYDSFVESVSLVIEKGQLNRIQFHNLSMLPNAEMAAPAYRRLHGLVTVSCQIINNHAEPDPSPDAIVERHELVIATDAMPAEAWCRARAFGWMTSLLFYNRLLHQPMLVAHAVTGLTFGAMLRAFMDVEATRAPLVADMRERMLIFAAGIQQGGPEYVHSARLLNTYWPMDEYLFMELCLDGLLEAFYAEATEVLVDTCRRHGDVPESLVSDALALNEARLLRPSAPPRATIECTWDVESIYRAALDGQRRVPSTPRATTYRVEAPRTYTDPLDWCREAVRDRDVERLSPVATVQVPASTTAQTGM